MKPLLIAMLSVLVLQQSFAGNLGPDQQKQIRRSFISVKFIGVNATESITVEVTNNTGKDIRDIRGGYIFEDTDHNYIYSTGFTFAVNKIFLKKDETQKTDAFYMEGNTIRIGKLKGKAVDDLLKNAESVRVYFEAQEIVYGDGSKEEKLEQIK